MKHHRLGKFFLVVYCLMAGFAPVRAQIFLHPNEISGTIQFNNANTAILSLLNAPGNEGMSNVLVLAQSLPPAPTIAANSDVLPVSSRTSASYQLTVDSADPPGIAYAVTPVVVMQGDQYSYWFNTRTSAPVVIGAPPPPLNFEECVGVVTVRFTTPGGAPVPVDGGVITAFDAVTGEYRGQRGALAAGVTQQYLYLVGGRTHRLEIRVHRGTDYYTNRLEAYLSTNVAVSCDQFTDVQMVLPDYASLGKISGTVDMLGEFESTVSGNPVFEFSSDFTSVIASGPFSNQRWGRVPGANFTIPSSGPFELTNVVPSTLDPASPGYAVYAQMTFRTNRAIEMFLSPALGWGANPALVVTPNAEIDLTNLFTFDPGYLRGSVLLKGPPESLGRPSLFRGMLHAGDDAPDGIPSGLAIYGVYWSTVSASGVDRLASGASFTASHGNGIVDFNGDFNPATDAYEGDYELVLGGLAGQNSLWKQDYLSLTLSSGSVTNDDDYYYNVLSINDVRTNEVEIAASQAVNKDVAYCFSEVKVVFRTTSGTFYDPQIRQSYGGFTNIDFQGQDAEYTVYLDTFGTPNSSATASNQGQVVMYLPEGSYRFYPSVVPEGGTYGTAGLLPLDVSVGCGQRIAFEPCLQLSLNAPGCANQTSVVINGDVRSCTNMVETISYSLNGGPEQVICNNCGNNPAFAFNLTLSGECVDNTLTVTASDGQGGVSSVTTAIHYDATPPVIACPMNLVAAACDTNGAVVNFTVTATDNCAGPVFVSSQPPSGSIFPLGTTTVNCLAVDGCGNTNHCSFTVTVGGSELSIERAIILRWSCGILQSADDPSGPWADVPGATSPYAVATTAAKKFYRTRN